MAGGSDCGQSPGFLFRTLFFYLHDKATQPATDEDGIGVIGDLVPANRPLRKKDRLYTDWTGCNA
jgi:hypothetical protein